MLQSPAVAGCFLKQDVIRTIGFPAAEKMKLFLGAGQAEKEDAWTRMEERQDYHGGIPETTTERQSLYDAFGYRRGLQQDLIRQLWCPVKLLIYLSIQKDTESSLARSAGL